MQTRANEKPACEKCEELKDERDDAFDHLNSLDEATEKFLRRIDHLKLIGDAKKIELEQLAEEIDELRRVWES